MNPKLVKFAVELQTGDKVEKKEEYISFKNESSRHFFNLFKTYAVTVPVDKD